MKKAQPMTSGIKILSRGFPVESEMGLVSFRLECSYFLRASRRFQLTQ